MCVLEISGGRELPPAQGGGVGPPAARLPGAAPARLAAGGAAGEGEGIDVNYNTTSATTSSGSGSGGVSSSESDPMFPLISDLITALHAEASANTTASTSTSSSTAGGGGGGGAQLDLGLEGATVEVVHAGGDLSFLAGGDLTALLSSLPLPPESATQQQEQQQERPAAQSDPMTGLIGDLFSALHSEANDVANSFPDKKGSSGI